VGCADAAVEASYPDDAESMTEDGDSLMMASDVLAASSDDRSVASYTHGAGKPFSLQHSLLVFASFRHTPSPSPTLSQPQHVLPLLLLHLVQLSHAINCRLSTPLSFRPCSCVPSHPINCRRSTVLSAVHTLLLRVIASHQLPLTNFSSLPLFPCVPPCHR
jgi:hypothetical protein